MFSPGFRSLLLKKIALIFLLSWYGFFAKAQEFTIHFGKDSDYCAGNTVKINKTGTRTYYLGSRQHDSNRDWLFTTLDSNGTRLDSVFIGTPEDDYVSCMQWTMDQKLIVCGQSRNGDKSRMLIMLLDTNGKVKKQVLLPFDGGLHYIEQCTDKGFIACGYTTQADSMANDGFLIKLDQDLNTRWTKLWGQEDNEIFHMVHEAADLSLYCSADNQNADKDYDVAMVKYNAGGDLLWEKSYGDSYTNGNMGFLISHSGNLLLYGEGNSERSPLFDLVLIYMDTMGKVILAENYGGAGTDAAFTAVQLADGYFYLSGYSNSYDPNKPIVPFLARWEPWTKLMNVNYFPSINQPGIAYDIAVDQNKKRYLLAGTLGNYFQLISTLIDPYADLFLAHPWGTSGIEKLSIEEGRIYPNPAQTSFKLNDTANNGTIRVFDPQGRLCYEGRSSEEVSTAGWAKGFYLVQIETKQALLNEKLLLIE